jgi:hypothetical protein
MADNAEYIKTLGEALRIRAEWFETSELGKLKDELRSYQMAFSSLYNLFLKKGLIQEDPYKQEIKMGELEIPPTGAINEAEKIKEISIRLSNFDNQLDFLVNFYQFGVEFLNLDRIKRILSLVKYIDWLHLSPESLSSNTRVVAELLTQIKLGTVDPITGTLISEAINTMNRIIPVIMGRMKILTGYQKELYKLDLRTSVTAQMPPQDTAQIGQIKKKFVQTFPGKPFYADLGEEVIKEDTSKEGPKLREEVLKSLQVTNTKPKVVKEKVSFKTTLIDGIQSLGTASITLTEITKKLDENQLLLENRKKNYWAKLVKLFQQMLNKEPDPVIYDLEYMDPEKGTPVKEKVNFENFRAELDKKIRSMAAMASRTGGAFVKLQTMEEDQLEAFLQRNVRNTQVLHRTLGALDEFFKLEVDRSDREKVKGIKPELAVIKNAYIRANQKLHEYSAQKEEEEQLRRLGVNPDA